MLTDTAARTATPRDKDYKLADSGGLYLFVTAKGAKIWRMKYRHLGKEKVLVLGPYPATTLRVARTMRDKAKDALAAGRDPVLEAKRVKMVGEARANDTFEKHARDWFETTKARWRPVHADDVITSMERDLFPSIGAYPVTDIDEPLILAALKKVEKRGSIETARRLRQRAERVFKWAKAHGAGCGNPAADVREAMAAVPKKRKWPALTDPAALRQLIQDVDAAGAMPTTKLASRFIALTAQRPGMVHRMPWTELHGIDWAKPGEPSPAAVWKVPSARMKLEYDLRDNDAYDHEIPLSQAAVDALHAVQALTGRGKMVFPSAWDPSDPISENAVSFLYKRIGYKGRHVPHGWRSAFSTIMNGRVERQAMGAERYNLDRLIVDLMLAHKPVGMSAEEFTYNRSAYMERRRELAEDWASIIMEGAVPAGEVMTGKRRSTYR
ncbi:phage integrase central domain-containing protein [Sphingomonas yantingensis]|uniref:Integrase n=1 Tax=Sphingomonas yantingensis TaxID=1241761 RepID=A0A7W9ASZ8_9SPHN|nr:integrase [Sphingomonas yantingensis]